MAFRTAKYGWIPDIPDHRDHLYGAPIRTLQTLPPSVDLTAKCPAVYDQGQIGSCTANAIGAALEFDRMKQGLPDFMPSRLFIYYNERAMEHTTGSDSGAQIRDGVKSVGKQGDCPETEWPYDPSPAQDNKLLTKRPTPQCYKDAKKYTAVQYQRIDQSLAQMKGCLAAGSPIIIGFTVYESFESSAVAQTGDAPMPGPGEQVLGGHAVLVVGYDDATSRFRLRNSWGTGWGKKGCFTLPYTYLTDSNLSSDFWTINVVN